LKFLNSRYCASTKHHSKLRPSWTQCMGPVCKTEAAKVSHDLDLTTGAWQGYLNNLTGEFHTYFGRANVRPQTQTLGKIDQLTNSPSTFIQRNEMCRSKSAERRNPLLTPRHCPRYHISTAHKIQWL